MAYTQKNKNRIIFTTIGIILVFLAVGIWLRSKLFHTTADINATVYPATLFVGDTLFYADRTSFSAFKEWSFGDGNISINDSGYYVYPKPGYYQVIITLNGKLSKSFPVQVKDRLKTNINDSVTTIEAPSIAMQYENIIFRANSKYAKMFSWKFGETGTIDSKEQMVIYAYQKPGNYTVTLYTDETQYPITHNIVINPAFDSKSDTTLVDDIYQKIDDDFKYHLQQIADGKDFNGNYNYLLNKYLCNNAKAVVKVNTSKINTFYYYCAGLQFDKHVIIENTKVSFDEKMNCVTKVEINTN